MGVLAALLLAAATVLTVRPAVPRVVVPGDEPTRPRPAFDAERVVTDARWRMIACVGAAGLAGLMFAGPAGGAIMAMAGVGVSVGVGRMESPARIREREETARAMPVAVDLLAACAAVGRPPDAALAFVASCTSGPLRRRLSDISARLSLGTEPSVEWRRHVEDPALGSLARTMVRTIESGAPLVDGLTRLAADRRRALRAVQDAEARAVGVKAAAPLGLCFLPAFMIVGVVPTVASLFDTILRP